MQTVNISLPTTLAGKLDEIVDMEGYASRSEFIRALLRFYLTKVDRGQGFKKFEKTSLKAVKRDLEKTGKYNDQFIDSVLTGLSKSTLYANN